MQCHYLVIDAGNTDTEVGLYCEQGLICSWRLSSNTNRTEDELFSIINSLTLLKGVCLSDVDVCCLASVVPELTRIYNHLFNKYISGQIFNISGDTDMGLSFLTEEHGFIGADLKVNAYSAREKYKTNVIIVDFGTATTIQLAGKDGLFYGSVISPGITTGASNLFRKASLISQIQLEAPLKILGTNTKDSLLSGIVRGHCLMTDSLVREVKREYSHLQDIKVIATGGIVLLLGRYLKEIDVIDRTLTIDGLYLYCKEQEKSGKD